MKARDRYIVEGVTCSLRGGPPLRVTNLSVGGLFAETDQPVLEGQVLTLAVSIRDRPAFPIVGEVSWINEPNTPRAPSLPRGFGIKIKQISMTDKLAIIGLLRRAEAPSRA